MGPVPATLPHFDCGTEDRFRLYHNLPYVHEALTAMGVTHTVFLAAARYDVAFGTQRLPIRLAVLRDHTAMPR